MACSYSVATFGVNNKTTWNEYAMISIIKYNWEAFQWEILKVNSTGWMRLYSTSVKESPQRLIKLNCTSSVCNNIWGVSFATN